MKKIIVGFLVLVSFLFTNHVFAATQVQINNTKVAYDQCVDRLNTMNINTFPTWYMAPGSDLPIQYTNSTDRQNAFNQQYQQIAINCQTLKNTLDSESPAIQGVISPTKNTTPVVNKIIPTVQPAVVPVPASIITDNTPILQSEINDLWSQAILIHKVIIFIVVWILFELFAIAFLTIYISRK